MAKQMNQPGAFPIKSPNVKNVRIIEPRLRDLQDVRNSNAYELHHNDAPTGASSTFTGGLAFFSVTTRCVLKALDVFILHLLDSTQSAAPRQPFQTSLNIITSTDPPLLNQIPNEITGLKPNPEAEIFLTVVGDTFNGQTHFILDDIYLEPLIGYVFQTTLWDQTFALDEMQSYYILHLDSIAK